MWGKMRVRNHRSNENANDSKHLAGQIGGEGEIRTPDTVARMPHFECGAFNHSATSPEGGGVQAPLVEAGWISWALPLFKHPWAGFERVFD